jgi:hypothetical protein
MASGAPSLTQLLKNTTDPVLLPVLAEAWKLPTELLDSQSLRQGLAKAMLDPLRAEAVWDSLDDHARGAMQMLIGSGGGMPENKFERIFGEIHEMGSDAIAREKPLQRPRNTSDALFYRGLIHRRFENSSTGPRALIFVPDDLRGVLPLNKTSYDHLEDAAPIELPADEADDDEIVIRPLESVQNARPADTSLVDDLTTMLAYTRIHQPLTEGNFFAPSDVTRLLDAFLVKDDRRLHFLTALAISGGVLSIEGSRIFPRKSEAQRWLNAARHDQVKAMAEWWRSSSYINDMTYVPTLQVDLDAGEMPNYDPPSARDLIFDMIRDLVPHQAWWSRGAFLDAVYEDNADFQRPNGDFNSWYIRNLRGEYLSGIESWFAVDGALLEYVFTGPMHWLCLVDIADGAARLNAYGRAFLKLGRWPLAPEAPDRITFSDNGTLLISRRVSRMERYMAARYATWVAPASGSDTPYQYRIDAAAIQQAAAQGISVEQIESSLKNASGTVIPKSIMALLDRWRHGGSASVRVERLIVLRTDSADVLNHIFNTPSTRRYLGARLGDSAVVVRADQVEGLRAALFELGIKMEELSD